MVTPDVKTIDATHVIATWDRVLIQMWRGEVTAEAVQELLRLGRAFIADKPGQPLNILTIIESSSAPPSDKVRSELSACFRELAPSMKSQLFVGEGSGFRAALIRGVGLAVSRLAPALLPFRFASSIDEAGATLAPHLTPAAGGVEGLKAAVTLLRGLLDQKAT